MKFNPKHKPKLGLALSGGGARGLAHIGVLKVLKEVNIQVDYLAGTSMGGVIAAAYASGMTVEEIKAIADEYSDTRTLMHLADPTIPRRGLFKGEQLEAFFRRHIRNYNFKNLRIPLTLVAVDLNSGQEVHLNKGEVASAIRATVSVPGLLAPVERDGQRLVDGGLLNNVPVDVARDMGADVVVAVDVSTRNENTSYWRLLSEKRWISRTVGGLIAVLGDSLELLIRQQSLNKLRKSPPDFLLAPQIPPDVTVISGYDRVDDLIRLGEEAARPLIDDILRSLSPRWFRSGRKRTPRSR